jgi:Protein of unknown function (DUF1236)
MRTKQNTLLASVAALALFAGTGLAMAQQSPQSGATGLKEQSGMHAQTVKPAAKAGMEQPAQSGTKGAGTSGAAALNTKGAAIKQPAMAKKDTKGIDNPKTAEQKTTQKSAQKSAEDIGRNKMGANKMRMGENKSSNKSAERRPEHLGANAKIEHKRSTARNESQRRGHISTAERNERARTHTAERNGKLKGLQGNASIPMQGSHISLTPEQRTRIRNSVIDARNAPRAGHVDFTVRVGTLVPRHRVHIVPVPETLVQIDPGWRGFLYFVVRHDVVIVNPRDMRIVAVLPA